MAYNPPPHYNIGGQSEPQQPPSVPPGYSPQPPAQPGYAPQPVQPPPPTQGMPTQPGFGPVPGPPPGPRRSPVVPLLAVGMVVGLAGAAVSLALWLNTKSDLDDSQALVDERADEVSQLEGDLDAAEAAAAELEVQIGDLESQVEDAESMQACIDALNAYYATAPDSTEEAAALDVVESDCAGWIY